MICKKQSRWYPHISLFFSFILCSLNPDVQVDLHFSNFSEKPKFEICRKKRSFSFILVLRASWVGGKVLCYVVWLLFPAGVKGV